MVYSILSPSEEISDQYAFNLYTLKDGGAKVGRLLEEKDSEVIIAPNPYDETQTITIQKPDIAKEDLSPISPMPPALLNRLNEQEIVDLFAYLMSGADSEHEIYMGKKKEE